MFLIFVKTILKCIHECGFMLAPVAVHGIWTVAIGICQSAVIIEFYFDMIRP